MFQMLCKSKYLAHELIYNNESFFLAYISQKLDVTKIIHDFSLNEYFGNTLDIDPQKTNFFQSNT